MTDWRRASSGRILLERWLRIGRGTARRQDLISHHVVVALSAAKKCEADVRG